MASEFDPGVPEEERSAPPGTAETSVGGALPEHDDYAGRDRVPAGAGAAGAGAAGAGTPSGGPTTSGSAAGPRTRDGNMLPARGRRQFGFERILVRIVATCGVIAIGVVIAAIMTSSHSQGWIIGLVVSTVSVLLSAVLWSSKQL
jgi:hypothetical protein